MLFNKKTKVLCIGSAGKDIFFPVDFSNFAEKIEKENTFSRICFQLGDKIHIKDRFVALGGCACNVSIGLSRLGISTSVFGIVGNDSDGEHIKQELNKEKINIKSLLVDKKSNTDISVILVDSKSGERTIFVNRDVGEKLEIDSQIFKNHEWCYLGSLYGDNLEKNAKLIHDEIQNNLNLKLAYNPGGSNIDNNPKEVIGLISHASLIFVNKSEASRIARILDINVSNDILSSEENLIKFIYNKVRNATVVLTNGGKGAWGFDGEKVYYKNPSTDKILDTTGAGDAFTSGFFSAILYGNDVQTAMEWGMRNSHSVIKFYGAIEGLLRLEELN